ncbi:MAG: DUF6159 family protein [bacterium]
MQEKKISHFKRARLLMNASYATLKADKELSILPLLSMMWSVLVIFAVSIAVIISIFVGSSTNDGSINGVYPFFALVLGYVLISFVATYFGAAIFSGATKRFNGENPTIKSSLSSAKSKIKPLFFYSLFTATIGLIFRILEERLPFAGVIAAYIFNAAWAIANIFSIPAIMSSGENLSPIEATKQSVNIVKKVWGENAIAQFGFGVFALFYILMVMIISGAIGALTTVIGASSSLAIIVALVLSWVGFVVVALIFSTLTSIVTAAVYYYATTGKSPEQFNIDILKQTITTKKSRKIFSN